jgi:hypothetical protein
MCYSQEGLQVLKNYLSSDHDDIYDPIFLAQMILSPLNSIVDDTLINMAFEEKVLTKDAADRNKKNKLKVLFRFEILHLMLDILQKHGKHPTYHDSQKLVSKLIHDPVHGSAAQGSHQSKSMSITGFTAAFFLTLPEFFNQWRQCKHVDKSELLQDTVVAYESQGCFWPTFAATTTMLGCMYSNDNSPLPYFFLPFSILVLFENCLSGTTLWITPTLKDH